MTEIKKKILIVIKLTILIVLLAIVILFFYAAFFFDQSENQKINEKKEIKEETQKQKKEESKVILEKKEIKKKIEPKKIKTPIKDSLFATVGNKAITRSDIVNEIKKILILNNMTYSSEKKNDLQQMAVKSVIKQSVKKIEIDKNDFLQFNQSDLKKELTRLANQINVDLPTLKEICAANDLKFSVIEDQIKTDLLWNSLIFYIFSSRVSVNIDEINEQLKLAQNKTEIKEYLISEIVIKAEDKDNINFKIEELKKRIENEGFESVAMSSSISQTAINGGDLGWLNENQIAKNFREIIFNTPVGGLSQPILIKDGILIFKLRNKKTKTNETDLEEVKNQLVNSEKNKILTMYSRSHYEDLRRSIEIRFFNE